MEKNRVFRPGEKLGYRAIYHWGPIWIHAGDVRFFVESAHLRNRNVYHLYSDGRSLKKYDWLYKVRDRFESWVDTSRLIPLEYLRDTKEGRNFNHSRYIFIPEQGNILTFTETNEKPCRQDTLEWSDCTYDPLAAVWLMRNMDFENIREGRTIKIRMILDNEIHMLHVEYLGKEDLQIHGSHRFPCLKFSAAIPRGSIFLSNEKVLVWVSDDVNRIALQVEAKILIGSVKAVLSGYENLKQTVHYPFME